jgi:hypothetical protein
MREPLLVIGGGFVGQLVQLARPEAILLDWRPMPPSDHLETRIGPQYLWEPIPGVNSFSFPVTTLVDNLPPEPERILAYKRKIGKQNDKGDWGLQFQHKTVGWHSQLPIPRVLYGQRVISVNLSDHLLNMASDETYEYDELVSTIPLPSLIQMLSVQPAMSAPFKSNAIYMMESVRAPVRGMTLNYISDRGNPYYRITDYGSKQYAESLTPLWGKRILPGKIHPNAESDRIIELLRTFQCYCFGRFATWRPDELAHQSWKEIAEWASKKSTKINVPSTN